MPTRDDETPPRAHVTERFEEIAAEVKRRSTRNTAIADLKALEILVALDLSRDDPRMAQVALIIRGGIETAVEASHRALQDQLAEALADIARMKAIRRAELGRRTRER